MNGVEGSKEKLQNFPAHQYKGFDIMASQEGTVKHLCEQMVVNKINEPRFKHLDKKEQIEVITRIRQYYLFSSRNDK